MSIENLTIRAGQLADADAVFALLTQFAVSYRPKRTAFDMLYPALLTSEHGTLLVAETDEQVVGYTVAVLLPVLYANGPIVEIQELMVTPEYRGLGIGTRLVESVIDDARNAGAVEVTVPTRRAGSYYLRFGFAETATYYKYKIGETAHAT